MNSSLVYAQGCLPVERPIADQTAVILFLFVNTFDVNVGGLLRRELPVADGTAE